MTDGVRSFGVEDSNRVSDEQDEKRILTIADMVDKTNDSENKKKK